MYGIMIYIHPQAAARTDGEAQAQTSQTLQLAVEMACQSCVKAVRAAVESVDGAQPPSIYFPIAAPGPTHPPSPCAPRTAGVLSCEVDLPSQSAVVTGSAPAEDILAALAAAKRRARVIGQGIAEHAPHFGARLGAGGEAAAAADGPHTPADRAPAASALRWAGAP